VTFLLPTATTAGGIRVAALHARELARRGHEVTVLSQPYPLPPLKTRLGRLVRGRGWPRPSDRPSASAVDELGLAHRVIERYRPFDDTDVPDGDAVVATWWETAEHAVRLSPRKGAKVYLVQHDESLFPGLPTERVQATYALPLHKIGVSRWVVARMREQYGAQDVALVPNSIETDRFFAPSRDKQRVPTVGLLYHSLSLKGVDVATRVLERVRRQVPNLRVLCHGVEHPKPELPLPDWVDFDYDPPTERLRALYASCDVWFCASRAEGFHMQPLEALACRCPVVSTRVAGPEDVMLDERSGRLVPVGDEAALEAALLEVLRLPEPAWRAMSDAALADATRLTWTHVGALLERALRAIVDRDRRQETDAGSSAEPAIVSSSA
jgi:glycosyltransferase involved in cell wall biosynthesis